MLSHTHGPPAFIYALLQLVGLQEVGRVLARTANVLGLARFEYSGLSISDHAEPHS
jgi:hypothetical protein